MTSYGSDQPWAWEGLDHARAAALLAGHLPVADGVGLEPLGRGDFCLAFRLGRQVVRVARHTEAATALEREACVLGKIGARLPLSVPRPTYHSASACPPFTVHDEVVGEVLTQEAWLTMTPTAKERTATDMAAFMSALHSLPAEIGLGCGVRQLDGTALAHDLHEASAGTIYSLLERETQGRLEAALKGWSVPVSQGRCPVLLHCDLAPGHLLGDPSTGRLTGIIDFGDLAVGEPTRDFIYLYEDYGPSFLTAVLERYAAEGTPPTLPEIRKWYLLEAVAWTVEMYRARRDNEVTHGLAEIIRELGAGGGSGR